MNKFTDDLLQLDPFKTPLSDAQWLLAPNNVDDSSNRWFEDAMDMINGTRQECLNVSTLFICFLAALSDEDLIEMELIPS